MGLLVSAFLALVATDDSAAAQAVRYGQLARGFVQSRFIYNGKTHEAHPDLGLIHVIEKEWRRGVARFKDRSIPSELR